MAASYKERQRLFRKLASTWDDYNEYSSPRAAAYFSRQAKTIRLSKEARKMLDIEETSVQPDELIRAISEDARGSALERRYRHLRQGQQRRSFRCRRPQQ